MADVSANESASSSKICKGSIIKNSCLLGDSENSGVSVWRSYEEAEETVDSSNRRHIREQAKQHIDNIIIERLESIETEVSDDLDEMLNEISSKRQLEREKYRAVVGAGRRKKDMNKTETESVINPVDNRLDLFIDQTLQKITKKWDIFHTEISNRAHPLICHLSVKEVRLSQQVAEKVDKFDLFMDKYWEKLAINTHNLFNKYRLGRAWCCDHKPHLIGAVTILTIVVTGSALMIDHLTAYEYMYNGKVLGIVDKQKDVYNTIDIIGDKLSCEYGAEITIDKDEDISFRKTFKIGKQLDDRDDILNQFTYLRDMNATAYAIVVNGQQKAVVYSEKCAKQILDNITSKFLTGNTFDAYKNVGFAENVEITRINTKIGAIQKEDAVLDYMLTGAKEIKTYEIKSGDTFSQVAKDTGLTMEDLMVANPEVDPEKLQIGQELILNRTCPVVTVETTEIAEYKLPIEYEIIYEETSTLYKGEQTVKSMGTNGERHVVAEITRHNGLEINRKEIKTETFSEPKNQVVLKGTKDPPPLIGTGSLVYPTRGRLTSRFGTRWGRKHNGIDLAAATGTKIYAADGGLVISAGWEGALGYCVKIDHGQNRVTVYGHCSKLHVKKGDRVYQNQHIANIGNTGRSTGPHLHFEVRIKGVPQNPLKYLK
ncbi:MAG TPA: M23 family metallopeptidase [Anaerovoracaceae bacterium]|nr:M23 family metallopeptidase [Anaerovoracaceae bacterium]